MLRPGPSTAAALVGMAAWLAPAPAAQDEKATPETSRDLRFVQGLRERGYFDLALEYLEKLAQAPDTPADVKEIIDFEVGRGLLEEASRSPDLERRKEQLDQARARLDAFVKGHPSHPLVPEALVQQARILVGRADLAKLQAEDARDEAEKQAKLAEARASFEQARQAYEQAEPRLLKDFESYPKFIPEGDPRRDARDRAHAALTDAQLQESVVDYEEGQTYPAGSKERNQFLDKALAAFEETYKKYRTQLGGLYARMWQAKCYEEKGELGPAMGIYNELMEHPDPRLRTLQRKVGYFRIIVLGKRKEYALAADEAVRWLQSNGNARRSDPSEWLGVQLELAKNILAQLEQPDAPKGAERDAALKRATDVLGEVVRVYSPHKAEALALLQKYRPRSAERATIPANLSYEDAMAQADLAISEKDWARALAYLKAAVRRADPTKDAEKANRARYQMAFCYYEHEDYYEAAVVAEHLARRHPSWSMAAKAAEIGLAALINAYNKYPGRDASSDLDRLVGLARYAGETFAETDQGDAAKVTLGEIEAGMGKYEEAARVFESVREGSSRHADALDKAGFAHWRQSQRLREREKAAEADAEAKRAEDELKAALDARQKAGASPTDPALLTNASELAEVELATDRGKEALDLLTPLAAAPALAQPSPALAPAASRLLATLLRAHIAVGDTDQALAVMKRLEGLGGGEGRLTQLYYELGRLLEKEMDARKRRGDSAGYDRTQAAYLKFLQALVASKAGQSYESLQWAGEAMLALSRSAAEQADDSRARRMVREADAAVKNSRELAKEAAAVFDRILQTYAGDEAFKKDPRSQARLFRTQIKRVAALRAQGQFGPAEEALSTLTAQNPRLIEPLIERGLLDEARAQAGDVKWNVPLDHWSKLAAKLRVLNPKPTEYFEATYHVAYCLMKMGQPDKAKATLKGVMRLSRSLGTAEMKARYDALLKQLGA